MQQNHIDHGRSFDWGLASSYYADYRDIYPPKFYQALFDRGIGKAGQKILDIGTGTGVLPRNMYACKADFTGIDLSENQIAAARELARKQQMDIRFLCGPAEEMPFPEKSFDIVTACQCFTYFDHEKLAPLLSRILKPGGRFVVLYMAWLPFEDPIAKKSEELVLKYNPDWTGCRETRRPIAVPEAYLPFFTLSHQSVFDLMVPFTRESWNGRMKSCRGIGASLSPKETERFDREHLALLETIAPPEFEVLHYAAMTELQKYN